MKGYWGSGITSCRDCHSGPKDKFWCPPCDHVAKAPAGGTPHCPFCRQPMLDMGHRWRPGKKGRRSMAHSRHQHAESWLLVSSGNAAALELLRRWGG